MPELCDLQKKALHLQEIQNHSLAPGAEKALWSLEDFLGELRSEQARLFTYPVGSLENAEGFVLYRALFEEAWIMNLAVREKERGLGKTLLLKFIEECRQQMPKLERIGLEVSEGNIAAMKLYARMGWKETSRRPGYYRDGSNAVTMLRSFS